MTPVDKPEYQAYREALSGDYSVRHKCTHTSEKSRFHIHNEFELLLCLSPDIRLDTGDQSVLLPRYSLLLFNNMDLHLISLTKPGAESDRYVVYFKPEYISALSTDRTDLLECFLLRPFPDANILPLTPETAHELAGMLDRIIALDQQPEEAAFGNDLQVKMMLAEYLLRVNRLYRAHHRIDGSGTQSGYRTVYAMLNHLHRNYADEISLDQLAHQFFVNKFYLCTLFREITGMTPRQYLISCRLQKARELLLNGMPVEEVCGRVGYNNLSHFSRAFKEKVGVSPKKYQLRMQDAQPAAHPDVTGPSTP